MKKYKVGIIGATGMVGQRFVLLTANHPWFTATVLAASGQTMLTRHCAARQQQTINLSLPTGLYIVRLQPENLPTATRKIRIMR